MCKFILIAYDAIRDAAFIRCLVFHLEQCTGNVTNAKMTSTSGFLELKYTRYFADDCFIMR